MEPHILRRLTQIRLDICLVLARFHLKEIPFVTLCYFEYFELSISLIFNYGVMELLSRPVGILDCKDSVLEENRMESKIKPKTVRV